MSHNFIAPRQKRGSLLRQLFIVISGFVDEQVIQTWTEETGALTNKKYKVNQNNKTEVS